MKKIRRGWLLAGLLLVCSCAQRIKMQVSNPGYQTDSVTAPVRVLSLNDTVPAEAVLIGTLKIGDNGFSKSGNLDTTLRLAREQAAKAGRQSRQNHLAQGPEFCQQLPSDQGRYLSDGLPAASEDACRVRQSAFPERRERNPSLPEISFRCSVKLRRENQ